MIITLNIIFILATVLLCFLTSRAPKPECDNFICKRDLLCIASVICGIGAVIFFWNCYLPCLLNKYRVYIGTKNCYVSRRK